MEEKTKIFVKINIFVTKIQLSSKQLNNALVIRKLKVPDPYQLRNANQLNTNENPYRI